MAKEISACWWSWYSLAPGDQGANGMSYCMHDATFTHSESWPNDASWTSGSCASSLSPKSSRVLCNRLTHVRLLGEIICIPYGLLDSMFLSNIYLSIYILIISDFIWGKLWIKLRTPQFHTNPLQKIFFFFKSLIIEHSEWITLHSWQRIDCVKGNMLDLN